MPGHARARWAAIISVLSATCVSGAVNAAPPVEAFGSLPVVETARISPDGKHVAVIRPMNGRPSVTIFQLDAPGATPQSFTLPNGNAREIYWANNTRLLSLFTTNAKLAGNGSYVQVGRFVSLSTDGGKAAMLLSDLSQDDFLGSELVGQNPADPDHVILGTYATADQVEEHGPKDEVSASEQWVAKQYYYYLLKVDVATGQSEAIAQGSPDTVGFLTDPAGNPVMRIDDTKQLRERLYLGNTQIADFDVSNGVAPWSVQGALEDGSSFTATGYGTNGVRGLYTYKLGAKSPGDPIFVDPQYDVSHVLYDEHGNSVIGVSYIKDKVEYKYFDPAREKIEQRLEGALPGQSVSLLSRDAAGANYVVEADGPKNPPVFYLFSPASGQLSTLAAAYPGLSANDLGEEKPYSYKSSDGLDIHAYLTLPPGKAPKNLPTVIFPHGGPADRDSMGFDWWAQFMASRGYAVLQPNFRGSTGYGVAFRDAGSGEWAGKVQDDISEGVRKLIADGIADSKRVCVVGASYGGYAALAAVTYHPELYACAISYAGVSDLALMLNDEAKYNGGHSTEVAYWSSQAGAGRFDGSKLAAVSPAANAERVKAPILLVHSTKDITVFINQSEAEQSALQHAGKSVEFVQLDGDDHYLTLGPTRVQLLKEVERFLAAHIGN